MSTKKRIFAVDPGFAQTKYAIDGAFGVIPSAIAEPMAAMKSLGSGQRVHITDRGKFVVGQDALEPGSKQIQSLDEDWLLKYLPVLILGAADHAKIDLHEIDVLSICLPPETWVANKGTLEDELSIIRDNGEEYVFDRVDLHAQGVGALGYHAMTGADPEEGGLVLDIGGNTILALRYDRLRVKATGSRQYSELGVLSAAQALIPTLSAMAEGRRVSEIKAMAALRARRFLGTDIGSQVDSILAAYTERILRSVRSDYRDMIPELDRVLVVGGGAYLVGDAISKEYRRVHVPDNPEFANVLGIAWFSSVVGQF